VFQLDGGPVRSLLRLMKPDNFEDISAVLALYWPGPMGAHSHTNYALRKNGQQEITPIHPKLEEPLREVLGPTYGLIVYQEQVHRAAQILAGYSLGKADYCAGPRHRTRDGSVGACVGCAVRCPSGRATIG
jgi:DNA polymerase III subunit alpha